MASRLETLSTKLSGKISGLSIVQRRNAILFLCKKALPAAHDERAISALVRSAETEDSPATEARIRRIAGEFDDMYLSLNEQDGKSEQDMATELRLFASARIASALTYLPNADRSDDAHEGVYEALMAFDNPGRAAEEILVVLETRSN